ncbi:MAG: C-type lectin domain-containing protein, partial [Cellvibrionales bacterium]|nr:C-type lectin domain-containing protein [Cellvibrionales bacterium]
VLNIDVSGDGKVAYLDIDFPVRTIVDSFDNRTHKKIKLYNISGYNTLETLNQKSLYGDAITDEEIDSIRIGQIGEYTIGSITNNDTRVQVINNPYEHISGKFTFVTAMQDARLRGGDVASIANEVDQQFVGDVLPKDDNELAWIGGYYRETPPPEKFVWVNPQGCTDDEIDFYNWGLGYPKVGLTIAKDPLEDEFGNTEADIGRGRIANLEAQEGLETDSPSYPKPLVDESMEIIAENPDLPSGYNFICVSGSSDFEDHGDWITHDKNILKSYILERKTDDALLKLHDIEGTTFVIEDELNLATTKQYKVLNIIEEGDAIYKIEAMEYNSGKFGTIEDNATLPVPRSPIVMNTNFTPPPENIYIEMLDEDEELGLKYGLKIFWNEVSAARLYRVQVFHSKQLIKTLELGNKKINRDSLTKQISYDFRDTSIEEGKSYYVRIEAVP